MEQRNIGLYMSVSVNVSEFVGQLKSLPLTLEVEHEDGVLMTCREFPEAYAYDELGDEESCLEALVRDMREWAVALSDGYDWWSKGRESEVPYLLKILVSNEEELLSCLRSNKSGSM